jgi:fluoroacetyl-CoA thioesterase
MGPAFDSASIPPGSTAEASMEVSPADTADALGSGDLPVLATPRMVALMEQAACAAISHALPPQATTVGTHIDVRHLAPTPVGGHVVATATVTDVAGGRVTFDVTAHQVDREPPVRIGHGVHARVLVDRELFMGAGV